MDNPNNISNKSDRGGVGDVKPAKLKPEGTPDPGEGADDGPHSTPAADLDKGL